MACRTVFTLSNCWGLLGGTAFCLAALGCTPAESPPADAVEAAPQGESNSHAPADEHDHSEEHGHSDEHGHAEGYDHPAETSATEAASPSSVAERNPDHVHDGAAHGPGHATIANFAQGVQQVDKLRLAVKNAFLAGDLAAADGPVHEIGHVLEKLPDLAKQAKASEKTQQEVQGAVKELFTAFSKIDAKLHGGKGADYADVEPQIDAAMEILRRAAEEKK